MSKYISWFNGWLFSTNIPVTTTGIHDEIDNGWFIVDGPLERQQRMMTVIESETRKRELEQMSYDKKNRRTKFDWRQTFQTIFDHLDESTLSFTNMALSSDMRLSILNRVINKTHSSRWLLGIKELWAKYSGDELCWVDFESMWPQEMFQKGHCGQLVAVATLRYPVNKGLDSKICSDILYGWSSSLQIILQCNLALTLSQGDILYLEGLLAGAIPDLVKAHSETAKSSNKTLHNQGRLPRKFQDQQENDTKKLIEIKKKV
eukprot:TRINITY_DN8062_c0_g1_i1.p1 TRINITY_DN8062_c0_g1~~TRINITY_DN8062_c0_g1_i1.p1  ORF type:complete len:289 (+),score=22.67 TRINITY_DN8062_c0_g1_i1:85-867(+)